MRKIFLQLIFLTILVLMIVNVGLFVHSIVLGGEINKLEKETRALTFSNIDLDNKINTVDSLQYAASVAASLNFTASVKPVYLDRPQYAYNQ